MLHTLPLYIYLIHYNILYTGDNVNNDNNQEIISFSLYKT